MNKVGKGDTPLPFYIQKCSEYPCSRWHARHADVKTPESHYHCNHPACHSKGLLLNDVPFVCQFASEMARHIDAHRRQEAKQEAAVTEIWRFVKNHASAVHQEQNDKGITDFRLRMTEKNDEGAEARSDDWSTRLYVGKEGATGRALGASIERFGTLPLHGPSLHQRQHHNPRTILPLKGHTIKFNKTEDSEAIWYGVCCGSFTEQDVLGESGRACVVRWFDLSHTGLLDGNTVNFYELTNLRQPQLLCWMEDWGDLLMHDPKSGFFVDGEDGSHFQEVTTLSATWYEDEAWAPSDIATAKASKEELAFTAQIFPTSLLYYVDKNQQPTMPACCPGKTTGQTKPCKWDACFAREFLHIPVITTAGPHFLRPVRYFCNVHQCSVTAGSVGTQTSQCMEGDIEEQKTTDPYSLSMPYYRLGNMRYQPEVVSELQAIYVDNLNVSACRRRLLDGWLSKALNSITQLKLHAKTMGYTATNLQRASALMLALTDLLPSRDVITKLLLTVFQNVVRPQIPAYDAAVAAFDGQLIRVDGTFRAATAIQVSSIEDTACKKQHTLYQKKRTLPAIQNKKPRKVYHKIGGCVLVFAGLEGLMLQTPELVPSENNASIAKCLEYIMGGRRSLLGSLSAPAALCSDSLRSTKPVFVDALCKVYPELDKPTFDTEHQEAILLLQDIVHREWVFTQKIARPKTHPDYAEYRSAVKDVFNRLRLPHRDTEEDEKRAASEWANTCSDLCSSRIENATRKAVNEHVEVGLLRGDRANDLDDFVTTKALLCMGNAAMKNNGTGEYIPRTVLQRAGRRLLMNTRALGRLLQPNGYKNGEDFCLHLEGVQRFYKTLRSAATNFSDTAVTNALGKATRPQKKQRTRRNMDVTDASAYTQGICEAHEQLVTESLTNIAHKVVRLVCACVCVRVFVCGM